MVLCDWYIVEVLVALAVGRSGYQSLGGTTEMDVRVQVVVVRTEDDSGVYILLLLLSTSRSATNDEHVPATRCGHAYPKDTICVQSNRQVCTGGGIKGWYERW